MSKRISKKKRLEIIKLYKEPGETIRSVAKKVGCTSGTVHRWVRRGGEKELPRNPNGPPGLSEFERGVFREMVRLTGYPRSYLFEYLAPVWGTLPSQARTPNIEEDDDDKIAKTLDPLTGKVCPKVFHPKTFYKEIKNLGLQNFRINRPEKVDSIAIHKVRASWEYVNENLVDGEIVFMLERRTGVIYVKAFAEKAGAQAVSSCFKRINWMLRGRVEHIHQVNATSSVKLYTSTLGCKVENDPSTPDQSGTIKIPGIYENKHELNWWIKKIINKINTTGRKYYPYNNEKDITPYKILSAELSKNPEKILKRLILPEQ